MTLADRHRSLGEQLRAHRGKLIEAQGSVETLKTQCAQLEGALALAKALMDEEATAVEHPAQTNGAEANA